MVHKMTLMRKIILPTSRITAFLIYVACLWINTYCKVDFKVFVVLSALIITLEVVQADLNLSPDPKKKIDKERAKILARLRETPGLAGEELDEEDNILITSYSVTDAQSKSTYISLTALVISALTLIVTMIGESNTLLLLKQVETSFYIVFLIIAYATSFAAKELVLSREEAIRNIVFRHLQGGALHGEAGSSQAERSGKGGQ